MHQLLGPTSRSTRPAASLPPAARPRRGVPSQHQVRAAARLKHSCPHLSHVVSSCTSLERYAVVIAAAAEELALHIASVNSSTDTSENRPLAGSIGGGAVGSTTGDNIGTNTTARGMPQLNMCDSADALWPKALRPPSKPYHCGYQFQLPPH
jgi:hypothetical protein